MSDEAGSTPLVQSKLARARAGRGSMLGPTPAAKKLAKPVPFGGVQTLPRRSPDASRSLIQATSRLSRNLTSPTSSQVQLSPKTEARRKTTAAGKRVATLVMAKIYGIYRLLIFNLVSHKQSQKPEAC